MAGTLYGKQLMNLNNALIALDEMSLAKELVDSSRPDYQLPMRLEPHWLAFIDITVTTKKMTCLRSRC